MWQKSAKALVMLSSAMMLMGAAVKLVLRGRGGPESDEIDLVTVFEGIHLRSSASAFMGGSTLALFGGVLLDLRRATLGPTGAVLYVTTLFGGTSIVTPPDWRVEVDARTYVGGQDLSAEQPDDPDAPTLSIRARTVFGGFQVESRPRLQAVS